MISDMSEERCQQSKALKKEERGEKKGFLGKDITEHFWKTKNR